MGDGRRRGRAGTKGSRCQERCASQAEADPAICPEVKQVCGDHLPTPPARFHRYHVSPTFQTLILEVASLIITRTRISFDGPMTVALLSSWMRTSLHER